MNQLPPDWEIDTLKELCLPITKSDPVDVGRKSVRYIDIGTVDGARHSLIDVPEIPAAGAPSRCRQLVQSGDTVFSTVRPYLEKIAYVDEALDGEFASTGFCVLRPGPRLDPKFLYYFSMSPQMLDQVLPFQKGVSYPAVLDKEVRATAIPVPPPHEQRRIVDVLEDHLSRLDAADREIAGVFTKLDAMCRSALIAMRSSFSGEARAPIDKISVTSLGKMLDAKKQTGEQIPYLRNINVRWGAFDLTDLHTTPLEPDEVVKFDIRGGDVMVCEGGEPGRCAVWRGDGSGIAFQKALHRIRVRDGVDLLPEFLALMLEEYIRSGRADRLFTGTTIKHLPQEKLRAIEIELPSLELQRAALGRLAEAAAARDRLRSSLAATVRHSQALRRSLLATAFSGRLTGTASDLPEAEEMIGA